MTVKQFNNSAKSNQFSRDFCTYKQILHTVQNNDPYVRCVISIKSIYSVDHHFFL